MKGIAHVCVFCLKELAGSILATVFHQISKENEKIAEACNIYGAFLLFLFTKLLFNKQEISELLVVTLYFLPIS